MNSKKFMKKINFYIKKIKEREKNKYIIRKRYLFMHNNVDN